MMRGDPVLAASITELRDVIVSCDFFPDLAAAKGRVEALLLEVEAGLSAASRPFRIVLAGGTGVGKSTLLNALAKADVAPVGATRPTTKGFTIYLHEEEHDLWAEGLKLATTVRHHREPLSGKAIIDSPDADSSIRENRGMLEEMIARSDLVLLVATQEKYVSESLLRLVREYRRGRSLVFVFNKTDICTSRSVLDDYTRVLKELGFQAPRIFAISAKQATLGEDRGDGTMDDEFYSLEQFIALELDRSRIKEIQSTNIGERVADLRLTVESVMPDAWESAAARWREHCRELLSELFAEIGTALRSSILDREELVDTITVSRGSELVGPFGFFSEVMYALHRLRAPVTGLVRSVDTENWVRTRTGMKLCEAIGRKELLVQDGCCHDGIAFGLDPSALRESVHDSTDGSTTSAEWYQEQLTSRLREELQRFSRPPGPWMNILVNAVPWAWLVFWVYRLVAPVVAGDTAPWEAIPGAAVVLLGLVCLEWSLVHRLLKWNARRRSDALVSEVLSGLETAFIARRLPPVARAASSAEACTGRLKRCLLSLQRIVPTTNSNMVDRSSMVAASSEGAAGTVALSGLDEGALPQ